MSLPEIFSFVLAILVFGGVAGLVAGLFGVGGGIIVVPFLYMVFKTAGATPDTAIHLAIGTSLLTIVPTSIASLRAHARHEAVDRLILKEWAGPIVIGSFLGSMIANHLSGQALSFIFGAFTVAIAIVMGLTPSRMHAGRHPPKGFAQKSLAFLIGLISSVVGIGGGSLTVPTLMMYRVAIHRAIGTASAIGLLITLPASIIFMLSQTVHVMPAKGIIPIGSFGSVNLLAFALLAPVTMFAAPLGAKLAHRLPAGNLRRIFACFLGLIALRMIAAAFGWA